MLITHSNRLNRNMFCGFTGFHKARRIYDQIKKKKKKKKQLVGFPLNVLRPESPRSSANPQATSHTKGTLGSYVFFCGIFVMVADSIASSTMYFSADELGKSPVLLGNGCDIYYYLGLYKRGGYNCLATTNRIYNRFGKQLQKTASHLRRNGFRDKKKQLITPYPYI